MDKKKTHVNLFYYIYGLMVGKKNEVVIRMEVVIKKVSNKGDIY